MSQNATPEETVQSAPDQESAPEVVPIRWRFTLLVFLGFFGGCTNSISTPEDECTVGAEGCPCTAGGACDGILTCLSDTCVDAQGGDGDAGSPDSGTVVPPDGGDNGDGDGDGDGDVQIKQCIAECESVSDCLLEQVLAPFSDDNWSCSEGACVYLGCHSTAECNEASPTGTGFICASENVKKGQPDICLTGCSSSSDCVSANNEYTDFDADNYSCTGGTCRYIGCLNDAECEGWLCHRRPHENVDFCVPPCSSASDCAAFGDGLADIDTDNWQCVSGGCIYQGCNNDGECTEGNVCHHRW